MIKICPHCHEEFEAARKDGVCQKPACKKLHTQQWQKNYQKGKLVRDEYPERTEPKKKVSKEIIKHKRKCLNCFKPCYPNYFYCKKCHAYIETDIL